MSGMNLILFVTQAQTTMNFILVAGCLIIEEIAMAQNTALSIDYSWIFSVYAACKLPIPTFCITDYNDGLQKALRNSWPKVLHGWSGFSIIRKGEQILETEEGVSQFEDEFILKQTFIKLVKNHTKTEKQFKTKFSELFNLVVNSNHPQ